MSAPTPSDINDALPEQWACERCNKIVPLLDTCIVPETLEIICDLCDQKRDHSDN